MPGPGGRTDTAIRSRHGSARSKPVPAITPSVTAASGGGAPRPVSHDHIIHLMSRPL
ncbi:MAG: hypothetical protein ACRDPD_02325 [Streptosporangiaceae bacterium]